MTVKYKDNDEETARDNETEIKRQTYKEADSQKQRQVAREINRGKERHTDKAKDRVSDRHIEKKSEGSVYEGCWEQCPLYNCIFLNIKITIKPYF